MNSTGSANSETKVVHNPHVQQALIPGILGSLPDELIVFILSKLNSAQDLCSVSLACRGLYHLANDDQVWRSLCHAHFPHARVGHGQQQDGAVRDHYKSMSQMTYNVRTGACTVQMLTGLPEAITRLEMVGNYVYTDSERDGAIKVWDIEREICIQSIQCRREGDFRCFKMDGNRLYTVLEDRAIWIWDITNPKDAKFLRSIEDNHNTLTNPRNSDIRLVQNRLFTCPEPTTMMILDTNTGEVIQRFDHLPARILCDHVFDDCLYVGLANKTVQVWDIESGKLLHTLEGHTGLLIQAIDGDQNCVYTGSSDNTTKIWDRKTGTCLQTLEGHEDWVTHIQVDGNRLYTASADGTVRIYDVTDPAKATHLRTLECRNGSIKTLQITKQFVLTCSLGETIQIWDKATGECLRTFKDAQSPFAFCKMIGSRLFTPFAYDGSIKIWDFSFPCLSTCPLGILEDSLKILETMASRAKENEYEAIHGLLDQLDPAFKQRIEEQLQRCLEGKQVAEVDAQAVIAQVQIEVYIEVLLHALHAQNLERVYEILDQIQSIDSNLTTKLYEFLAIECNKVDDYGRVSDPEWGGKAFHDSEGYDAPIYAKLQAVLKLKETLQ